MRRASVIGLCCSVQVALSERVPSMIWVLAPACRKPAWRRFSLPSRNFAILLAKEWHGLLASRAYWLLLFAIGPLVGQRFISAVDLYAEVSGAGRSGALSQGLTPLDGILVPTFGAYDLAVTLLFPFVAIRLISEEKASGAWKLMLQSPASLAAMLAAKGVALLAGWLIAWTPGLLALILWKLY